MAATMREGSPSGLQRLGAALLVLVGAVTLLATAAPGGVASAQAGVGGVTLDLRATDGAECPGANSVKTEVGQTLRYCIVVTNTTDAEVPAVLGLTVEDLLVPAKAEAFNAFGKANGGAIRPGDSVVIEVGEGRVNDVHSAAESSVTAEIDGETVTDTVTVDATRPSVFVRDQLTKTASRTETVAGGYVQFDFTLTNLHGQTIRDVALRDNICGEIDPVSGDTNGNGALEVDEVWIYRCTYPVFTSGNASVSVVGIDADGFQTVSTSRVNMVVDGVEVDGDSGQRPGATTTTALATTTTTTAPRPTTTAPAGVTTTAAPTSNASVFGTTTVPIVSGPTLPLTGAENGLLKSLAVVLVGFGLLVLAADRWMRGRIRQIL